VPTQTAPPTPATQVTQQDITEIVSVEWLRVRDLGIDPRVNTKPLSTKFIADRVKAFNPNLLGVPDVSKRADGSYVVLDGQHRREILIQVGWADKKIQCRVYYGLSIDQEARIFLGRNDSRKPTPVARFLAEVQAYDPEAVAINTIVEKLGWRVHEPTGKGCLSAIEKARQVWRESEKRHRKPNALESTLAVVTEAWGMDKDAVSGWVLYGIGMLYVRYGDAIDGQHLIRKLAAMAGGPLKVLAEGKAFAALLSGTVGSGVSEYLVGQYNQSRRVNRLPEWRG
jgi:uncharacterized protein DUF6551